MQQKRKRNQPIHGVINNVNGTAIYQYQNGKKTKNKRRIFEKRFNVAYIYIQIYIVNDQSDALA